MDLNKYLDKYCIKQAPFARKAGLTYTTLYNIKKGKTRPTVDSARKIEKASEGVVTVDELMTYQDRLYRCNGREKRVKEYKDFIAEINAKFS